MTIGLKSVENPLEFGIVVTDEEGRIERFLEKPSWGQVFSDTINTGIYVMEPEVLKHVPGDRPYDFSKELFPYLLEMGRPLYGYVMDGYWQDIGNLDQFRQANFDALEEKVRLNIPGIRIRGNVWLGEGVEIGELEQIEGPAYIGNYCRISPGATVGSHAVLSNSVTLRERTRVTRSVIDASTHIGRSAVDRGRDPRPVVRHPRACPHPRGRGDRRRGDDRRGDGGHAGRSDLPVQGRGVRIAHSRERDLGVACLDTALREGRRCRARQRRPHARGCGAYRCRTRNGAQARGPRCRKPGVGCPRAG